VTVVLVLVTLASDSGEDGLPDVSGSVTVMLLSSTLGSSFLGSFATAGDNDGLLAWATGGGLATSVPVVALFAFGLMRLGPDTAEIKVFYKIISNIL